MIREFRVHIHKGMQAFFVGFFAEVSLKAGRECLQLENPQDASPVTARVNARAYSTKYR